MRSELVVRWDCGYFPSPSCIVCTAGLDRLESKANRQNSLPHAPQPTSHLWLATFCLVVPFERSIGAFPQEVSLKEAIP